MITRTSILFALATTAALAGCKKNGTGGGGGGWLVGREGLMANVTAAGELTGDYPLGSTETLHGIACRFEGEAFVVGAHGTLLYTEDGGQSWISLAVPTSGDLRALATQDAGPVYVAGDGALLLSRDAGDTWTQLSDGHTNFRSIAAAQRAATVLAISDDGGLYAIDAAGAHRTMTIAGARAVGVSPDGASVVVAGTDELRISRDAGRTFDTYAVDGTTFAAARIDDDGEAIAAGTGGLVAHVTPGKNLLRQRVGTADLNVVHLKTWGADGGATGFLAGEDGQVYLTSDAGWSWRAGPNVGRAVLGADELGAGHN